MTNSLGWKAQTALLVEPFPKPPATVQHALTLLTQARAGTKEEKAQAGPVQDLPKPWILSSCGSTLRRAVFEWLEAVVPWINYEYSWQRETIIPSCWVRHPHIINELAPLAVQRWEAANAADATPIEDWHRYSLPQFLERMRQRLGSSCSKDHEEWPARSRAGEHHNPEVVDQRQEAIQADYQHSLRNPQPAETEAYGAGPRTELDASYLDRIHGQNT